MGIDLDSNFLYNIREIICPPPLPPKNYIFVFVGTTGSALGVYRTPVMQTVGSSSDAKASMSLQLFKEERQKCGPVWLLR